MSLLSEDMHRTLGDLEQFVARLGVMGDPAVPMIGELWTLAKDYEAAVDSLSDLLMEANKPNVWGG